MDPVDALGLAECLVERGEAAVGELSRRDDVEAVGEREGGALDVASKDLRVHPQVSQLDRGQGDDLDQVPPDCRAVDTPQFLQDLDRLEQHRGR